MQKGEKSTDAGKKTENKYTKKINSGHIQKSSEKTLKKYLSKNPAGNIKHLLLQMKAQLTDSSPALFYKQLMPCPASTWKL